MASSCTAADRTNLTNFNNSLSNCTTTADSTFNSHIGTSTHIKEDIDQLRANVLDSLHMGDAMFAKTGHLHIAEEVQHRNKELKEKKEKLTQEIKKGEAIIQKSNRDFSDVKNSLPETSPKKRLFKE
jgi:chaperonin cofactor prefoldin